MVSFTIYGELTKYDRESKRTDTSLEKFDIELAAMEDWKAPLGFNVTAIRVNE
jgi:hypothetical protein